ncbi:hypothetical protein BJ165DRAFT_1530384 [Panaeolus papilionaceus]|nr:hypothetical protein BJ165DRAFT_1530384 [Panaeolus papilionaceus]
MVLLILSDALRVRDPNYFNIHLINGPDAHNFKPIIRSIRPGATSFRRAYDYVTRGDDAHGPMQLDEAFEGSRGSGRGAFWDLALGAVSKHQAHDLIMHGSARAWLCSFRNIKGGINHIFNRDDEDTPLSMFSPYTFDDLKLPPALLAWKNDEFNLEGRQRVKTLILVGPSRIGKTEWARSLHPDVAYMESSFDAAILTRKSSYLVLSDVPGHKIARESVLDHLKCFFGSQPTVLVAHLALPTDWQEHPSCSSPQQQIATQNRLLQGKKSIMKEELFRSRGELKEMDVKIQRQIRISPIATDLLDLKSCVAVQVQSGLFRSSLLVPAIASSLINKEI